VTYFKQEGWEEVERGGKVKAGHKGTLRKGKDGAAWGDWIVAGIFIGEGFEPRGVSDRSKWSSAGTKESLKQQQREKIGNAGKGLLE